MASPKPAVIVRREFLETPTFVSQQLRACIIGPSCQLVRYSEAAEKGNGLAATLASLATDNKVQLLSAATLYSFPNIASTSELDPSYVKVFMEDALLTYAVVDDDLNPFYSTSNSVAFDTSAWRTANGTNRTGNIPQDVAVGDTVQLYDTSYGLLHTSTVTGFTADNVAATVTNPTGSLRATTTASQPTSVTAGGLQFTLGYTSYLDGGSFAKLACDPRIVGKISTTYTVTVTGVGASTIDVSVVSDTGLDTKSFSGVGISTPMTMTSGLTLTTPGSFSAVTVGTSSTFTVQIAHVVRTVGAAGQNVAPGTPTAYTGSTATTYIIACTAGGSLRSNNVQFRVTTNNGVDVPSTFTLSTASQLTTVAIGSLGVKLNFAAFTDSGTASSQGFVTGDVIRVTATPVGFGAVRTLVFADPYGGTNNSVYHVRLSKKENVEIPQIRPASGVANWVIVNATDATSRAIQLSASVLVRSNSVNSGGRDLDVTAGKLYFQYRAFQALPRAVGSINSQSDITTQLGTIHPDNPLAFGVYKAFQNANGATVHYIPTVSQTLNGTRGFADALALSKGNRNCYSLVPLSTDPAVWAACNTQVQAESAATVGRFRVMWIAPEINSHFPSLKLDPNGAIMFGTSTSLGSSIYQIDAVDATGTASNPRFATTVKVGDWLRTNFSIDGTGTETYKEYKVTAVLDNNSITVSGGLSFTALVNDRMEIYRDLTSAELAAQYVAIAGGFASERVFAVVPDRGINGLQVDGTAVKNWYVACAFAGLRSGSRPQQPLSNVELLGFDGISTVDQLFSESDLDVLRDGGVWAVRNTDDSRTYVERQLSTSVTDLYRKEQSITCNIDSISFSLADALKTLVGRVNITPETTSLVEATIRQTLGSLTATNGAVTVGPQLKSYTLVSVTTPSTAQDTILVRVSIQLPLPMNVIDITLVI